MTTIIAATNTFSNKTATLIGVAQGQAGQAGNLRGLTQVFSQEIPLSPLNNPVNKNLNF
jgi:hypothetical protein